jgi:hypothetical protein
MNLGLWVIHPDLGQPSQTDDHGKNENVSGNGPVHRRGQFSQSIMGRETDGPLRISISNTLVAQVCLCSVIQAQEIFV